MSVRHNSEPALLFARNKHLYAVHQARLEDFLGVEHGRMYREHEREMLARKAAAIRSMRHGERLISSQPPDRVETPPTPLSAKPKTSARSLIATAFQQKPERGAHVGESEWDKNTAAAPTIGSGGIERLLRHASSRQLQRAADGEDSIAKPQLERSITRAQLVTQPDEQPTDGTPEPMQRRKSGKKLRSASSTSRLTASVEVSELLLLELDCDHISEPAMMAGKQFNDRHGTRTLTARGVLNQLRMPPLPPKECEAVFNRKLEEVFRNRLFVDERHDPFEEPQARRQVRLKRRERWHLDRSIWAPRKQHGNSKDYYENEAARLAMFKTDWRFAHQGHGLDKLIVNIDGIGPSGESVWADKDRNGVHDAVDATKEVLWRNCEMLYGVFDYYCTIFGTKQTEHGEYDVFNMYQNAYCEFYRDCGLDQQCANSILMYIWAMINAEERKTAHLDPFNLKLSFNRHEFIQSIVRIAIATYLTGIGVPVAPGESPSAAPSKELQERTVAGAVAQLCDDIKQNAPPECHQNSNTFRKHRCYNEFTDAALRKHEGSLRRIFEVYAAGNRDINDKLQDHSMMSVGEWCEFLKHIGLFDMGQVSQFGAKIIFKWSLIRTARNYEASSLLKLRNMYFEDFLEALVRVACVMALPNDEEIEEAKALDAGEFLLELVSSGESGELNEFVEARRIGWVHEPRQSAHRCVSHLLALIMRTVERNTSRGLHGKANMVLNEGEVKEFETIRRRGRDLLRVCGRAGLLDGIRAAASIVRARLLDSLRRVEILQKLDDSRLALLADSMTDAPFEHNEWVFEQGDEGDAFFVIIEGSASVVRFEMQDNGTELGTELALLTDGMFFGERALLKQQTRYAGVRVDSKHLHCVYITRADFEEAMGCTLEDLVPDRYKLNPDELRRKLREVPLLRSLYPSQLAAMMDAMREIHYPRGHYVFKEGDEGDAFYIILSGKAVVLKRNAEGGADSLAELGQWSCFGERALLRDETRYAGICVTSKELSCLRITRELLEAALGAPPREVLTEITYTAPTPQQDSGGKKMKRRGSISGKAASGGGQYLSSSQGRSPPAKPSPMRRASSRRRSSVGLPMLDA